MITDFINRSFACRKILFLKNLRGLSLARAMSSGHLLGKHSRLTFCFIQNKDEDLFVSRGQMF